MEVEKILKDIKKTASDFLEEKTIKIGSFEKTEKELKETLENEIRYQEIFENWFPHEEITPEALERAPKRIIRSYVLATVVDFALKVYNLPSSERNIGRFFKTYLHQQLIRLKIDSIELEEELKEYIEDKTFIRNFAMWLYL